MGAAPILTILKDGETVRSVPIEGEALLGRDEGCVIRLEDRMISRQHALFRRKGNQIQVEKKSQFAPMLINGADCTQAVLKEGDVIAIGPYLMKLSSESQSTQNDQQFQLDPPNLGEEGIPDLVSAPASDAGATDAPVLQGTEPAEGAMVSLEPLAESSEPVADPIQPLTPEGGGVSLEPVAAEEPAGDSTRVVATNSPRFELIFKPGDANVLEYQLQKDEIFIGRGKDCDIILTDKKVSRKNTQIFRSGNIISLRDLGSANGTYVNGKKVSDVVLSAGDKVRIGEAEFEFRADQPGYAEQEKDFLVVPPVSENTGPVELPAFQMDAGAMPMLGAASDAMLAESPMTAADPAYQAQPDPSADPGIAGIAGLTGASSGKRKSLMEKFRALPKSRQWVVIGLVIALGYLLFFDEEPQSPNPGQKQSQAKKGSKKKPGEKDVADKGGGSRLTRPFSALSREKQAFVRTQHKLAFEYFQHQDFANALTAIKPIFEYVDDFEDSREIQQYAEEGIRRMKIMAEEKAKKEAEEAKARKITSLLNKARELMEKKQFSEATSIFNDVMVIDPENAQVVQWQGKIREYEENQRIEAQRKQVQAEINNQAWAVYKEGLATRRRGELRKALSVFGKVKDIGAVDARPARLAGDQIKSILNDIKTQLEPLLNEAKEKVESQDFVGAMASYSKALSIEPGSSEASAGMERVKLVLNERAKALYTEAVLAESYSDFAVAKKKFQQCSETAPKDSVYHERSIRKLARYFKADESASTGP